MASQKRFVGVSVISNGGAPSRILIVLLISLGMTTLPRSSILLTIPVAFIYIKFIPFISFFLLDTLILFAENARLSS